MHTTVTHCPIGQFVQANVQPEIVFDKEPGDHWLTATSAIRFDGGAPEFTRVVDGDLVRVPMFAYRTISKELHVLAGLALDLGVRAILAIGGKAHRMHVVLGDPVVEVVDPQTNESAYRLHIGLAFLVN